MKELTLQEKTYYQIEVDKIKNKLSLPIARFDSLQWYWSPDLNVNNGIMAQFAWWNGRGLLNADGQNLPKYMIPQVIHELRHKHQWDTMKPVMFFIVNAIGAHRWSLDLSAREVEAEAERLLY